MTRVAFVLVLVQRESRARRIAVDETGVGHEVLEAGRVIREAAAVIQGRVLAPVPLRVTSRLSSWREPGLRSRSAPTMRRVRSGEKFRVPLAPFYNRNFFAPVTAAQ